MRSQAHVSDVKHLRFQHTTTGKLSISANQYVDNSVSLNTLELSTLSQLLIQTQHNTILFILMQPLNLK